uniref:Uncharacterized protein n=1 Tax=Romanomermis culicivorax TaxID=13658 RepID=A0A915HSA2_ROMCU
MKFKNAEKNSLGLTFGPVLKNLNQFFKEKCASRTSLRSILAENETKNEQILPFGAEQEMKKKIFKGENTCFRKMEPSSSSLTQNFNFDDDYEQKSTNFDENSPSTSSKTASLFDVLEDNFSGQKRKLTTEKKEISSSKPTNLNL